MVEEDQPLKVTRVIDFRIPLPWLLSGLIVVGWALVSMWFSLNQLVRDLPVALAKQIYRASYWDGVRYDELLAFIVVAL